MSKMLDVLERFNNCKKTFDEKVKTIEAEYEKALVEAGNEFAENYKSLIKSLSEDEFIKFIGLPIDMVDEMDKIAAIIMRMMEE